MLTLLFFNKLEARSNAVTPYLMRITKGRNQLSAQA